MREQTKPEKTELVNPETKALPETKEEETPYVFKFSNAATKTDREKFWEIYDQKLLDRIFEIKQANII